MEVHQLFRQGFRRSSKPWRNSQAVDAGELFHAIWGYGAAIIPLLLPTNNIFKAFENLVALKIPPVFMPIVMCPVKFLDSMAFDIMFSISWFGIVVHDLSSNRKWGRDYFKRCSKDSKESKAEDGWVRTNLTDDFVDTSHLGCVGWLFEAESLTWFNFPVGTPMQRRSNPAPTRGLTAVNTIWATAQYNTSPPKDGGDGSGPTSTPVSSPGERTPTSVRVMLTTNLSSPDERTTISSGYPPFLPRALFFLSGLHFYLPFLFSLFAFYRDRCMFSLVCTRTYHSLVCGHPSHQPRTQHESKLTRTSAFNSLQTPSVRLPENISVQIHFSISKSSGSQSVGVSQEDITYAVHMEGQQESVSCTTDNNGMPSIPSKNMT